jgi:esterase/lipase superfamily enzyme
MAKTTRLRILLIFCTLIAAACNDDPPLMDTPKIYTREGAAPFAQVPPDLQNNKVQVIYLTDRAWEKDSTTGAPIYGIKRSRSVAFGICEVQIGKNVTWDQLVKASMSDHRDVSLSMKITKTMELGRFPPTPRVLFEPTDTRPAATQPATAPIQITAETEPDMQAFQHELSSQLAKTPVKEVYIFVHGVKNDFTAPVFTIAQIWHFLGRQGVPIAYCWPSGGEGLLRGYDYDYNSSEFTVFHLKNAIRAIASNPDVKKVNIIAHSRGTDACVTAIRELNLEIAASGRSTRALLKLGTVVLAAPDLALDVAIQRCATARLGFIPELAVIYISPDDSALGLSSWLFGGSRLGNFTADVFSPEELQQLRNSNNPALVEARVSNLGNFGHDYFYTNSSVSSDLILTVRNHLRPGAENGRPLGYDRGFWIIDDNYPNGPKPGLLSWFTTTRPSH